MTVMLLSFTVNGEIKEICIFNFDNLLLMLCRLLVEKAGLFIQKRNLLLKTLMQVTLSGEADNYVTYQIQPL